MPRLGPGRALVVGLLVLASACGDSGDTTTTTTASTTTVTSPTITAPTTTRLSASVEDLVEIAIAATADAEAAELRAAGLRESLDEASQEVTRWQQDVDGWLDVLDDPDETVTADLAISFARELDQAEQGLREAEKAAAALAEDLEVEEAEADSKQQDAADAVNVAVQAQAEAGGEPPGDTKCPDEEEEGDDDDEEEEEECDADPALPSLQARFEKLRAFCLALGGGEGTPNQPIGWAFAPISDSFEGLFGGCGGGGPASLEAILATIGDLPGVFSTEIEPNVYVVVFPANLLTQRLLDDLTTQFDLLPVDEIPAVDDAIESAYLEAEPESAVARLTPAGATALSLHLSALPFETFFLQPPDALGTFATGDIPIATPRFISELRIGSLHQLEVPYLDAVVGNLPDPGIGPRLSGKQRGAKGARALGATKDNGGAPGTTAPPTTVPAATSPPTTVPPTTSPPTTVPPTTSPPTTSPPTTSPPTTVPPTTSPPTTVPPTTSPPDVVPPTVTSPSASPGVIYSEGEASCARVSTISVTVTDNVGVTAVRGVYGGLPGSPLTFSRSGTRWSAQFGPFPGLDSSYAENIAIGIIATDAAGNEAGTLTGVTVIGFCVR